MKCGALIVDGRNLLFRCSDAFRQLSTELEINGEKREIPVGGMYGFLTTLTKIHRRYGGRVYVAWEGKRSRNFRRQVFPEYKKRPPPDEATQRFIEEMNEQEPRLMSLLRAIGVSQFAGANCEADDVLARLAVDHCADKQVVIYTGDSDLRQLCDGQRIHVVSPGFRGADTVYTPEKVLEKHGVPPRLLADMKALSGDNSDNIPGLKSIGDKTAAALLNHYGSLKAVIKAAKTDDKTWPVAQRFKGVVAAGEADAKLYRELTGLRLDAEMTEIERKRSKAMVATQFAAYKFRSLLAPSELLDVLNLGVV